MSDLPGKPADRENRLQEVIAAYLEAAHAGQPPPREQWLLAHPDLADDLSRFLDNQNWLLRLGTPVVEDKTLDFTAPGSGAMQTVAEPPLVRYFGDYELLEEIARGGMGVVYRARQVSLNRPVALKRILSGPRAGDTDVRRFRAEAEAAANLDHPNIVPIYEVGEHQGQQYYSMKLIEGGSLTDAIPGLLQEPRRAAALLARVARAVYFAHQRGILHRDLKPGNILLDLQGEPHVADFGLARRIEGDSTVTQSGAIVGTASYMPPEQARAEKTLTTAADVWSLGAILYECLTGRPPFAANSVLDTLLEVIEQEPVHPRKIKPRADADLVVIALKCLRKSPPERYDSAGDLADDKEYHTGSNWEKHAETREIRLLLKLSCSSQIAGNCSNSR